MESALAAVTRGRVHLAALLALAFALALPAHAGAVGGTYAISGGTPRQQTQVRLALEASSFDWSILPGRIDVVVQPGIPSLALPGRVWLDAALLDSGIFSWAVVQDEFAHQIDYLLLRDADRELLNRALGGRVWCHGDAAGLAHADYGCERFTSTFVWAYWPVPDNAYRPRSARDESAALEPRRFRALLQSLVPAVRPVSTRLLARSHSR